MQRILNPPPLLESLGLLERAVGYTRLALREVTPAMLGNPTPCERWDLAALLKHMVDGLEALTEAADLGCVSLVVPDEPPTSVEAVMQLREQACSLLGAWSSVAHEIDVMVGDRPLSSSILAAAGALEVAVHGWDVSQATGANQPVPALLALDLLPWVPVFVTALDVPERFAPELDVPMGGPSSRLLALVGRQ
jgi:uncharacterized protein (TIGR03086 family)